jgi:nitrous oxide reductase accessory protein NosL
MNNKSLTSSPCDDMAKVPIPEQKTKNSVGKENAMNLSDHASSESDGDTDAM